eukprot:5811595-Amphidinium_carterae.1
MAPASHACHEQPGSTHAPALLSHPGAAKTGRILGSQRSVLLMTRKRLFIFRPCSVDVKTEIDSHLAAA